MKNRYGRLAFVTLLLLTIGVLPALSSNVAAHSKCGNGGITGSYICVNLQTTLDASWCEKPNWYTAVCYARFGVTASAWSPQGIRPGQLTFVVDGTGEEEVNIGSCAWPSNLVSINAALETGCTSSGTVTWKFTRESCGGDGGNIRAAGWTPVPYYANGYQAVIHGFSVNICDWQMTFTNWRDSTDP